MHSLCKNDNIPMWEKPRCRITKEIALHLTRIITLSSTETILQYITLQDKKKLSMNGIWRVKIIDSALMSLNTQAHSIGDRFFVCR